MTDSEKQELKQKKIDGGKLRRDANNARYSNASSMCLSLLRMNYDYEQIIERLKDEFDYTDNSAKKVLDKNKRKLKNSVEKKIDKMAEENINRIEAIIDECYEQRKYTDALKGIDMLNKMGGQYTQKIDLNGNLDQTFNIKIRED